MLTYNDEKFIVETLESVKMQTYPNIELVISDDKSQDRTLEVAKLWIEKNRSRFDNVIILESEKNIGVTANSIRATNAATGEWIKGLGGDNLMTPDCIEKFVQYIEVNPQAELVQCRLNFVDEDNNPIECWRKGPDAIFHDDRTTTSQQYELELRQDYVDALGLFKKKSLLSTEECYDKSFRNQEDTPFAYRVLKAGHKFWFLHESLVVRRMRAGSLSSLSDGTIVGKNNILRIDIDKKYVFPEVSFVERLMLKYKFYLVKKFFNGNHNKKAGPYFLLWRILNAPIHTYYRKKIKSLKGEIVKSWVK